MRAHFLQIIIFLFFGTYFFRKPNQELLYHLDHILMWSSTQWVNLNIYVSKHSNDSIISDGPQARLPPWNRQATVSVQPESRPSESEVRKAQLGILGFPTWYYSPTSVIRPHRDQRISRFISDLAGYERYAWTQQVQ